LKGPLSSEAFERGLRAMTKRLARTMRLYGVEIVISD